MKAWELISGPGAWTQGFLARDRDGKACLEDDSEACCFCMMGAIKRVYGPDFREVFDVLLRNKVGQWYPQWNDRPGRTQAEVVAVLKELDI